MDYQRELKPKKLIDLLKAIKIISYEQTTI